MDRFGEWRPIEPAASDDGGKPASESAPAKTAEPARPEANVISVRLVGLLGAAVLAVVGAVLWLSAGSAVPSLDVSGNAGFFNPDSTAGAAEPREPATTAAEDVVVDVEGAVVRPGVHRLPAGSRVGDAITAAGGYSPQVDIAAASSVLNLAAPLSDGSKIHVPARGEAAAPSVAGLDPSLPGGTGQGGPINVNTASAEELDTLPGIGPVTAAKIIDARASAPFATVDELLSREVVGASTFEKLRELVTVGP